MGYATVQRGKSCWVDAAKCCMMIEEFQVHLSLGSISEDRSSLGFVQSLLARSSSCVYGLESPKLCYPDQAKYPRLLLAPRRTSGRSASRIPRHRKEDGTEGHVESKKNQWCSVYIFDRRCQVNASQCITDTLYIGEDLDGRDTLILEAHIRNWKTELILTVYL